MRFTLSLFAAVAVASLVAGAAWAQEASPSPSPTPSESPTATPSPTSPSPTPTPTPSESPSPSPTPTPTPTPPPTGTVAQGNPAGITIDLDPSTTALDVGDLMKVEVLVTNNTPEDKNLTLSVTLPEQLGYVESKPLGFVAGGGPPPLGEFIGVTLGNVAAGSTSEATFTLRGLSETPGGGAEALFEVSGDGEADAETILIDVLAGEESRSRGLELDAAPPTDVLGEVGDLFDYSLTVSNTGDEDLKTVIVVQLVPDEVHVTAAPLIDGVDAVQVGRFLGKEDIVWVMDELEAGEQVQLPWSGVVESSGDLLAQAKARATARNARPASVSASNFLASPETPTAPVNPPFTPIAKRVAIEIPVRGSASGTTTGVLPFTGMNAWSWTVIGAMLLLTGFALYRFGSPLARGKRIPAALALISVIAAGCVSSSDQRPRATGTPEVQGRRIERGPDGEPRQTDPRVEDPAEAGGGQVGSDTDGPATEDPTDEGVGSDEPDAVPGVDAAPEPEPQPAPPAAEDETITRFVTREVTLEDLPVRVAPSTPGSTGSFGWDVGARSVVSATSSRTVVEGSPLSVITTVRDTGGSISVDVSLLNDSEDERVLVNGRLVHEVGGGLARLDSAPIDTVLSPGGRVTATYEYLLPSGAYDVSGFFVAGA